jgi:DNA-binding IclR family transcriptional regulator
MIPQAVLQAYRDARLARGDLRVWAAALETLSFYQPRPFKVAAVARVTGIHVAHVAASVRRLTAAGYLERGPQQGQLRTYLLRTSTNRAA